MALCIFPRLPRGWRAVTTVSLALLLFPLFAAAAPQGLSLDRAIALAVQRAPSLDARRFRVEAARHDVARADALPDPTLTVGIDNMPITGAGAFGFDDDMMTMKRIGLMQAFPSRAKRDARQALAERGTEQARALGLAERLAVKRAAATAWVSLWAAERELQQLQALGEQSELAVDIARARLGAATATATDVMATQAAQLQLENRIEAAQAQVDAATAELARWLGEPASAVDIETDLDFGQLPVAPAALLASVDRQGPLLLWGSREALAAAEVALAASDKRPDWSVAAAYGQREGGRSDMLMLEFSIDLPLFTANRQDRDVAARRAELDAVAAAREDARREQLAQVRSDLAQWAGLKRQVERDREQLLPLANDRVQTAIASYRAGGPLQPWLDARRDELQTRVDHARRLGELGRAWAALAYLIPNEEVRP